MSEVINVPDEWEIDSFKSLKIKLIDGDRGSNYPKDEDFFDQGHCIFLSAKNVTKNGFKFDQLQFINKEKDDKLRKGKLERNDIVLTTRGTVGNISYFNKSVKYNHIRINSGMIILRNENKTLVTDYLYKFLNSNIFDNQIGNTVFGSAQPQLTVKEIEKFFMFFPKEKKEQEKIAKILSTLDTAIESTQKLIDKEKNIKKGLMSDLLQNGIDKNGKIRTPKTHKYKDSELGPIPEEWEVDVVENHSKIITGNKDTQDRLDDGVYPFYVRSQTVERINSYSFDGEAVLTAGDGVGVGKVFHHVNEKFDFHQRVYCIHEFSMKLDSKFFFEYFKTYFIEQVNKYSAKGSVDSVRYDMIALMNIPMPNIDEQIKIAKILNIQDKKIEKEEENLAKLKELKKALMSDLLSGKVRVKV
ncbi:hypothetical protein GCM10012288_22280 [Malaciobacter pacificus]|uniref:Type I restriction/modification system, specificity subunit n=1 Tax=Malaciobacter pacificus TaxID=1080223 RepID=A0A5C2H7V2_9BACT|nr:restriction endonuclease subunit S [Malaciobacter pacificus]QEP34893.1 type I restriction/modification system, specificity subunit [Malaciobacter pacificus]GGD47592.1 hypothetical protein GCM10012288_22280 [Malaciobacter pacificus]